MFCGILENRSLYFILSCYKQIRDKFQIYITIKGLIFLISLMLFFGICPLLYILYTARTNSSIYSYIINRICPRDLEYILQYLIVLFLFTLLFILTAIIIM